MTSEALAALWARRLAGVHQMADNAEQFKECEQCRSIAPKHYGLCPFCHCYRFIEEADAIRATLEVMAQNPWPVGAGVVPRINEKTDPAPQPPVKCPSGPVKCAFPERHDL